MRILVIGGTGFVGPHILRRLVGKGHEILCVHRGRTKADLPLEIVHLHGDRERLVDHRTDLARFGPEVVVDTGPMAECQARTLMLAVRDIARRVVALSSGDVYRAYGLLHGTESGPPEYVPIAEDAPLRQRLFPYRGQTSREPDDRASGRVYNVSEAHPMTEAEWVQEIGRVVGWRGEVVAVSGDKLPPRLKQPGNFRQHLTYDTTRIRKELNYGEGLPRAEAIRRTVDWERSHPPDRVDPQEFDYAAEDAVLVGIERVDK